MTESIMPVAPPPGGESEAGAIRLSLIVVHYRTPEMLQRCLDSIADAGLAFPYEILVIDNAPVDDTAERECAGRRNVLYIRNDRNVGLGRAVNQAILRARGSYLLNLNPDVEVGRGSIEELIAQMERDPSAGLVAPKLLYPDGQLQHSCRTFYTLPVFLLRRTFLGRLFPNHRLLREHLMLDFDHESTRAVDWCLGAALLARRGAVEDVGPMDERFFLYFEDVDWCYRMQARGWKVLYVPASVMVHRYQRESAKRPGKGLLVHLASTFRYYEKWSFVLYWFKLRSSSIRRAVLVLSDFTAVNLAFVLAYAARSSAGDLLKKPMFGFSRYVRFLAFTDAVALLALALAGMYRSRRREEAGEQVLGAFRAIIATALLMMASTFLFSSPVYSRAVVGLFLPAAFVLILLLRWGIFRAQGSIRSHRLHLRRVGLLAPEADSEELERRLSANPDIGLEILPLTTKAAVLSRPRGGDPAAVEEAVVYWVEDERIAEVVVFEDWWGLDPGILIDRLSRAGIPVRFVPRAREALRYGAQMGDFLGMPALQVVATHPAGRSWEKRLMDGAGALVALALLLLPYLLCRALVMLGGGRMVERELVGRRGKRIRLASLPGRWPRGLLFTALRDFPTLLLCLSGEWSFVGIHPFEAFRWPELPEAYRRFPPDAPPGWITFAGGPARPISALCASNREYVGRWSLALDMNLILNSLTRRKGER